MKTTDYQSKPMTEPRQRLPYNPADYPRELTKYYISASQQDIDDMLDTIGKKDFDSLFDHIDDSVKFKQAPKVSEELHYDALIEHMAAIAEKNNIRASFLGDSLKNYKVPTLVPYVCNIRGLTTAYTPYQPERSQGTLMTLWMYSSSLSMLTGFEAINASFYDRSTCLFEAANTATRIVRNSNTVIFCESLQPCDMEVVKTLAKDTDLKIQVAPLDRNTGRTDLEKLKEMIASLGPELGGIAFPQINSLGILEDVHALTDLCHENHCQAIAVIDPMSLATGGLVPPSQFGRNKKGAHMIVGEGQHLAIGPNYGGPGLGIFGIRFNDENKLAIRQTAGRYVGKTVDSEGKSCLCMVLSTREQHIRREKATSNICSNQSFLATLAGASILARGEDGMRDACTAGHKLTKEWLTRLTSFKGVNLAFKSPVYNEFVLEFEMPVQDVIELARKSGLHIGVDISERVPGRNLLQICFTDVHTEEDLNKLHQFFNRNFEYDEKSAATLPKIEENLLRREPVGLPSFKENQLQKFYTDLGHQNLSPDDNIYPLGSCTMKYNPWINDWAAGLKGFTDIHPQAPIEDAQGSLEILYGIQEMFKGITGLPGVTTEPVAGAQGELVGLKMFQAYHRDRGNGETKDVLLIPRTAHGTNPATATMAGYKKIVTIEANDKAQIDFSQLKKVIAEYGNRIAGIMVTNPNTSGIFEKSFKEMADLIHSVDGLVYMDGANMNAIAGWVDLGALGVDAVHNNLHKTWTIPHGGGGPGDAIVAVSEKLVDYLPGHQVRFKNDKFELFKTPKSIGTFHRHFGNFAHKVRAYTYIKALGDEGIRKMAAVAVLSAKYLFEKIKGVYPTLPFGAEDEPRMHEFILTIKKEDFDRIQNAGTPKAQAIAKIGKLFLDFGLHAPTVAFPEVFGLMVEPTESFSKSELDRFLDVLLSIHKILNESPEVLATAPHFTPVRKVDEVSANKDLCLWQQIVELPPVLGNVIEPGEINLMKAGEIEAKIREAHARN